MAFRLLQQPLRRRVQRLARVGHLLADQVAELDAALQARDEFLAMVSHELKTPLSVILGDITVLKKQLPEGPSSEIVGEMELAAMRLQEMMDDLITLARLEAVRAESEPILLQRVCDHALRDFEKLAPDRTIRRRWPEDLPAVAADEGHVRHIMHNLLTNAHKYSPPESPIEVSCRLAEHEVIASVRDHGPGIPPDQLESVFTPFFRSSATRDVPGAGLGLSVCLRLVQLHRGRIWVQTSRRRGGTEICFALPLVDGPPDDEARPPPGAST